MAVTSGYGNPRWTQDETILALDLYLQCRPRLPSESDPRVLALSAELRALPYHTTASKNELGTFRNPPGVSFKLQNLRNADTGEGLKNISLMDRKVWKNFGDRPDEVKKLAAAIRANIGVPVAEVADDEVFREGRIITALHLRRERSPSLRRKLLKSVMSKCHSLQCEACGEGPKSRDVDLADATFEVHHRMPLHQLVDQTETRLQDVALLCASCHRLLHRAMSLREKWIGIQDFKQEFLT